MNAQKFLAFGPYLFLIVPSILLMLGVRLLGSEQSRRRVLFFLVATLLSLLLLILAIRTNPHGMELSSSLPAFSLLPVLVALLGSLIWEHQGVAGLWAAQWAAHRATLAALLLITPLLFALLWLTEPSTFYFILFLTGTLAAVWLVATRASLALLAALSLADAALILLLLGGSFIAFGLENPAWFQSSLHVFNLLALVLGIFLSAAVLYTGLRGEGRLERRQLSLRLALVALLVAACAYQAFWEGVWSAAHARAFEDNLPFAQFFFGLIAALMLALALHGRGQLAGPAFAVVLTAAATLAFIWGWRTSAFELTEKRAAQVETAITRFYLDNGRFPSRLAELTPRYLLYLRPPVVVRQGGWCYQGGGQGYRLGYVSGRFTYFKADFFTETHAQAGSPPAESWACDKWVDQLSAGGLSY